jgi:hypothetical protein
VLFSTKKTFYALPVEQVPSLALDVEGIGERASDDACEGYGGTPSELRGARQYDRQDVSRNEG